MQLAMAPSRAPPEPPFNGTLKPPQREMQQRSVSANVLPQSHSKGRPGSRSSNPDSRHVASSDPAMGSREIQKEKDKERKAMLSRALQKAHRAVLLDNAHNFEGAIDAYTEACDLLHQVLVRSTADEERRKLEHIRDTYSNRVKELIQQHRDNDKLKPPNTLKLPNLNLSAPIVDPKMAPPPLSPRRLPSTSPEKPSKPLPSLQSQPPPPQLPTHNILDKSQAEFDAALDAAIEAAYDDGFEPDHHLQNQNQVPKEQEPDTQKPLPPPKPAQSEPQDLYDEAGMLNETPSQELEGFDFGLQNKAAAPRKSDSSAYSGSTWNSSVSSSRATGSSSLTTVAEANDPNRLNAKPSLSSLPRLSEETARNESSSGSRPVSIGGSVRDRRLSGQNAKQLKIETQPILKTTPNPTNYTIQEEPSSGLKSAGIAADGSNTAVHRPVATAIPPPFGVPQLPPLPTSAGSRPLLSPADTAFTISPATPGLPPSILEESYSPGGHKIRPNLLRKNKSSMSLKQRALSVSSPDGSDGSVTTPLSSTSLNRRIANTMHPSLPTPPFIGTPIDGSHAGTHIFKTDFHSPHTPGFPNPLNVDQGPITLEKCPEPTLLRPFWLLRCVYQTIANPAGGYVSTRLYVTPSVWNTKGVKLKSVDEKIAACEMLVNALNRLTSVDSYDAQAVLDEMQALEGVLDSVQTTLTKKLGHEVGVTGTGTFLKDAPAETNTQNGGVVTPGSENPHNSAGRSSSKSYLSSWRKLRSRGASENKSAPPKDLKVDGPSSAPRMASVPMTRDVAVSERGSRKRDLGVLGQVTGPNAPYMIAIAKLCDAVQIVDQIARQVEDPGLRGSSQTHVGLELSTRHASEFFAFYVCRWILGDLATLVDKFVKRSTEWVLT